MSLFCRHGRFTADCSICSKGTVLDQGNAGRRRSKPRSTRSRSEKAAAPVYSGPHVATPTYEDSEGSRYVVRLEKVPGGVRLAEWAGAQLRRRAPQLELADLAALAADSAAALDARDAERLVAALRTEVSESRGGADAGVSRGRTGDFKEELRIEPLGEGRARVARWVLRPGSGWELQDAAPMLPAARYAEAIADAARRGLLAPAPSDPGDAVRL